MAEEVETPAQQLTREEILNLTRRQAPLRKEGLTEEVIKPAKPVVEETAEEDVFDPELKEVKPAGKEKPAKENEEVPKLNLSRFKPYVGKDEFGEDDVEETFKSLTTKNQEYENTIKEKDKRLSIVAEGKTRLTGNKDYQFWNNFLTQSAEEQVTAALAWDYMEEGLTTEQATTKAKERITDEVATNKHFVEDTARNVKRNARAKLGAIEQNITKEIEDASKDITFVTPSVDFEKKVQEYQPKMESFLGMPLTKDEAKRTKLVKDAYLSPEKLNEKLKDPATYNKVCFMLAYEKQYEANYKSKTNGKADVIQRFPKVPSGSGLSSRPLRSDKVVDGQRPKAKDGVGFMGENARKK